MNVESLSVIVGATIVSVDYWGPLVVQTEDGEQYEVSIMEGHSGPEFDVRKARRQYRQEGGTK